MTLGIFLSLGESFTSLRQQGQAQLMIEQNIRFFSQHFAKVFVFTYLREKVKLPQNCTLVIPPLNLHRYLYGLLLPFIHHDVISKLDVIRCYHLSGTLPALVAKILFGKKFVFNLGYDYEAFAQIESRPFVKFALKVFQPLVSRAADRIIVKNKTLLQAISLPRGEALRGSRLPAKSTYIPNGVDPDLFKPPAKNRPKTPIVLFVGRLEPQKNLPALIQAMAELKTPSVLKLVGRGSLQNQLKKQARVLGVALKILSPVPHNEIVKIYQSATIFVLPSLKEGSPKVLLEALSCALPCIASDIPEHQEIIHHQKTGLLSKPTSIELAKHMQLLLNHKDLRHELGIKARQHMIKNFNIKKVLKQELACLETL